MKLRCRTGPVALAVCAAAVVSFRGVSAAASDASVVPAPAGTSVALLADDVMVFRQIGQLRLTAGQIRECVQLLSILNRTLQDYQERQRTAALPVAAPLHRVREALAAGQPPDETDQAKVDAALAPLKPAAAALERQRRETIRGILHALTPAQLDMLRATAGEPPAAEGASGEPARTMPPGNQNAIQALQAQMQAIAQQRQEEQKRTTAAVDDLRKQLEALQQQAQQMEAANQQAGNAGGPDQNGDPNGDPTREMQRQLQESQRQAQMARRRAEITRQSAGIQVQMANRLADFAQQQAEAVQKMAQLQREIMQRAGQGGMPQEAIMDTADHSTDEDLVNRLFLRPNVLTFLRARAGQ